MNEITPQVNSAEPRHKQNALWAAGLFSILGLIFFAYSIYIVSIVQQGRFDLSDKVLMPVAAMMFISSVYSYSLIRRDKLTLGTGILFFTATLVPPLLAVLVLENFGAISVLYMIILASLMLGWVLPKESRRWATTATIVAILISIGIEVWNPEFRIGTNIEGFVIVATLLAGLGLVMVLVRQAITGNIRTKLILGFLLVSVLSVAIVATTATLTVRTSLQDQVGNSFTGLANNQLQQIDNFFLEKISTLRALAVTDIVKEGVERRNNSYSGSESQILAQIQALDEEWVSAPDSDPLIQNVISADPQINPVTYQLLDFAKVFRENIEVFVTDRYGATISASGRLSDYNQADEAWWQAAWNNGQGALYISEPEYDESANATALLVALPIVNEETGKPIGVLRSTITIDSLYAVINETRIGNSGYAVLFDSTGNVLFDPRADTVNSAGLPEEIRAMPMMGMAAHYGIASDQNGNEIIYGHSSVTSSPESDDATTEQSKEILNAVAKLGWTILVRQNTNEAFASVNLVVRNIILVGFGAFALAALVASVIAQLFVRPLGQLTSTAQEISAGDLTQRAKIQTNDEVGTLATAFNSMTSQIQELIGSLEERVAERTADLEQANQQVQHRAEQFESIAQVTRTISSIQNLSELLPRITRMISQSFGFYHVGIFLLDERKEYAVLRAANSEGGQNMLARDHRLKVGQVGIVGYVTSTGSPRIALDVGADAVYFDNPDLPETRSELALPLRIGQEIIGALDVQSMEPSAFTQEDISILSTLADQVSTAIQNVRLYEESRNALADAESAYRQLTGRSWIDFKQQAPVLAYRFNGVKPEPFQTNGSQKAKNPNNTKVLSIPVKLRGVTIGRLQVKSPSENQGWSEDDLAITQAIADRVALAADNARLVIESQKRAAKEQSIGEFSTRIGETSEIDKIMATAVGELQKILGASEVTIRLNDENE